MSQSALPANATEGATPARAQQRALRTIAAFEAFKGLLALIASLGFLSLLHHDLHHLVAALIGHIGLNPGDHYPALVLGSVDQLLATPHRTLLLLAGGYVLLRWLEAYGLWHARPWGEWLGALSGALYIPFELRHFAHQPSWVNAAVVLLNLVVVGFLGWRLRQRHLA